ncbi:MAG TPA: chromosome segregation SMC family protein, partial [Aestuariivirga sp.]|nr:chromosome segregation SMC family protein [Aestuariivirga sp.]
DEQRQRIARLERDASETSGKRQALLEQMGGTGDGPTLAAAVDAALAVLASNETVANHAEVELRVARQVEADTRQAHDEARRKAEGLQTEVRTLTNLLKAADNNLWPALVDQLKVERGYEAALGAALGDDIDASSDEGAPTHWRGLPPLDDGISLPGEALPLSNFVQAPQALARRLSQIGVVSRSLGQALQAQLRAGQRLVSREGDVWRWDGFTSAADAPSAAAKRLAERNRLSLLEIEMRDAAAVAAEAAQKFEAARQSVEAGVRAEREKRDAMRAATSSVDVSRQALARHERQIAERLAQTSALDEGIRRITQSLEEARSSFESAQAEFQAIPVLEGLAEEVAALRDNVNRERAAYAEARARHDGLEREAKARADRINVIEAEARQWGERAKRATEQIAHLTTRAQETREAIAELSGMPQILADKRHKLMNLLQEAETERKAAADALAEGENAVRMADQVLREAQELASSSREDHARLEARLEASRQRHEDSERRIAETLQCAPSEIVANAGLDLEKIEDTEHIERRLLSLREDRERLGGVNLRAEEEAETVATQLATLIRERDDLVQAINKLRGGISSLNREGRQRLLDAFGTVNEKFGELFTTLFGGGKAELQLIESDDPLEAGLEILANPPGKKPTVLSLLSGGEQTLTALALIFAVFLTNPSPICVLDEVDAPLDDH